MTAFARLRARARAAALFPPTGLAAALQRMGFVQADPIRAPARAQDLILRHRVGGYRAGDLDRAFVRLRLEEDFLHAYGFMPADTRTMLHPRPDLPESAMAEAVLAHVRRHGLTHPAELDRHFGAGREVNGWGGVSKATTRALERLSHHGLLRVARRRDGIRLYQAAPPHPEPAATADRARHLVLLLARSLAPVSLPALHGALALMARRNPALGPLPPVVAAALRDGALVREMIDGVAYLSPPDMPPECPAPQDVRLLAPFDPLVWDRRRFEHLWGWPYRFEAYTPPARRQFGYYALPLLWGDAVIGWANLAMVDGAVQADLGFAKAAPRSQAFARALDAELARFARFMTPRGQTAPAVLRQGGLSDPTPSRTPP